MAYNYIKPLNLNYLRKNNKVFVWEIFVFGYPECLLAKFCKDYKYWDRLVWANSADIDYLLLKEQVDQGLHGLPFHQQGAPVAQWVKHWPTDPADQIRSSPEAKSSQP